ncbi:Colicin I receptor precursor [compost metagenome]
MRKLALPAVLSAVAPFGACATDAFELNPTTITASQTEHAVADAPASVTVISAEEIQAKGATNLLEALRGLPGITLTGRQVGGRKNITIRGMEDRHTLVLIDGRRISSTDDVIGHSDYQYGWVSMDQVERIELVRGPMSALYGSEAMGGVVNIITRKATPQWHGNGSLRGDSGAGDGHVLSALAGGPLGGGLSLELSAEDLRRGATPLEEDHRFSEIEGQARQTGSLSLGYQLAEGHDLTFDLLRSDEERWRHDLRGATEFRDQYDIDRSQESLGYTGQWSQVRSELRYTRSKFDVANRRSMGIATTRPQALRDDIADGSLAFALGERHFVTLGGEYREEELENAGLVGGSDEAIHQAIYLQDEVSLAEDWALTLGARLDRHEMFGSETSPRAYLVWRATPDLTFKAGYGEAFRAPTLKQISPNYVGAEGPHTFYGNPDIQPETSRSYELGVDWRREGSAYTATLFHNDVEDLIDYRLLRQVGPRRFYIYDNISRATIDGFEASAWQALGYGFALSASFLYLDARNDDTDDKLNGRPEVSMTPTLEWNGGPWGFQLSAQYTGEQYLSGNDGQEKVPDYTLLNLTGSYRVNDNLRLRAGLLNASDVRLEDKSPLFGYAEAERSAYLALDMSF